ncbi:MAG: VOC family protein [Parcubacteria group bacterium]|jgi:predicted metalloenzyme YecM
MSIKAVIGDYKIFLEKIFSNLKSAGFEIGEFKELDHIGYRVENLERYYELKKSLAEFCEKISDKEFAGRPVLVCKLKEPLNYGEFKIEGIEVLAPKEDNKFEEGLEHAEFVTKTTLPEFLEKHKNITFNLVAYDRKENPELVLEFENCAVKFHEQSLLRVRGM